MERITTNPEQCGGRPCIRDLRNATDAEILTVERHRAEVVDEKSVDDHR